MPQHIVITGGSSGLGAALGRLYAKEGHRLTLFGRDQTRLAEVSQSCRDLGARVRPIVCDVTNDAAMERALHGVDAEAAVDLIVANAGLGGTRVMAAEYGEPAALARDVLAVNSLGVVNTVAPLLERFLARRSGHIVLIGSLAGLHGLPQAPAYSASKAAIRMYGHGLRRLLAAHGIQVTIASPGFIETPMSASLPFPAPFVWSAERAAARIKRGIARREAEIIFPWQLRMMAAVLELLPTSAGDRLLAVGQSWLSRR